MITRRTFLRQLAMLGGLSCIPFNQGHRAYASPYEVDHTLIVILMRGAADALSILIPYREEAYYRHRPNIAIAAPHQTDGAIDLNGYFGIHPSLGGLMPAWENGSLAFIHAFGSPAETRSHFEAQDILETASLHISLAKRGWLNGLSQVLPDNLSTTRLLSFGNTLPKIVQGPAQVATVPTRLGPQLHQSENPRREKEWQTLYQSHPDLLKLYENAVQARASIAEDLQEEMMQASQGAPEPNGFSTQTKKAADLIRNDKTIQLVFMDVGGWDTHVNQGNARGQLANKLEKFGEGLTTLTEHLGPRFQKTTILIMSEFGRTVAQNGNGGTDHGHGSIAWLLGGSVKGGKIYGTWPGLENENLYQGRDLAVTTDFRSLLGHIMSHHYGLSQNQIASLITDYPQDAPLLDLFI